MKTWEIVYTRRMLADLDEAFAGYEERAVGLGDRFVRHFRNAVALLSSNPYLFGEVKRGVRAATIEKFPFIIYYRTEVERVVLLAVRHGRDDPRIWKRRV